MNTISVYPSFLNPKKPDYYIDGAFTVENNFLYLTVDSYLPPNHIVVCLYSINPDLDAFTCVSLDDMLPLLNLADWLYLDDDFDTFSFDYDLLRWRFHSFFLFSISLDDWALFSDASLPFRRCKGFSFCSELYARSYSNAIDFLNKDVLHKELCFEK